MCNVKLNNEFIACIIDGFEDFLTDKGINIPNEDRDHDDPEGGAIIYGMDFAELMEMIRDTCENFGVEVEDTWEEKEVDMTKYYIIPKDEIALEINMPCVDTPEKAMMVFANNMSMDMNEYFVAVTEKGYEEYKAEQRAVAAREAKIEFYEYELSKNFDVEEKDITDIAEKAYEIYCNAGSYPYCDVETEYDALTKAVDEFEKGE